MSTQFMVPSDKTIKVEINHSLKRVKIRDTTVSIGYGGGTYNQSINIKSSLSSIYNKLSANNFSIELSSFYMGCSTSWATLSIINKSYNSSTGVLSYSVRYSGAASDSLGTYKDTIYCWYIE